MAADAVVGRFPFQPDVCREAAILIGMAFQAAVSEVGRLSSGAGITCGSWHEMHPSRPSLSRKQRLSCICSAWLANLLVPEVDDGTNIDQN